MADRGLGSPGGDDLARGARGRDVPCARGAAFALLAGGTIFYALVEGWTIVDALYFSVITLATVGYGDLVPTTVPGKLFTAGYVLAGVGVLAAFVRQVALRRHSPRRSAAAEPG